jgi:hypothetical protein
VVVFWIELPELKVKVLLRVSGAEPEGYVLQTSLLIGSVTDVTRQKGSAAPVEQVT